MSVLINFRIDEKFFVNKVGDIIMLVPKDDVWAGIKDSAGKMSNDFMVERIQNIDNKRNEREFSRVKGLKIENWLKEHK